MIENFLEESTCFMPDCSRASEKLNYICAMIETLVGVPTDVHLYFSRYKTAPNYFGIHKDVTHNLIVQLEGTTKWTCGSRPYFGAEVNVERYYDDDSVIEETLEPGDCIFIPAFVFHRPESITKRISASFPMPAIAGTNFERRKWLKW